MRTMIKTLNQTEDKEQAVALLNDVKRYIDQLTAKGIVHRNAAAHHKSRLEKRVSGLS